AGGGDRSAGGAGGGVVERVADQLDDVVGDGGVDLVGGVDEAGLVPVQPHLPGEIEGMERNAVPADTRPRIERHEPERLGGRGVDHFLRVDVQAGAHGSELVGQRDVDVPEDVLV